MNVNALPKNRPVPSNVVADVDVLTAVEVAVQVAAKQVLLVIIGEAQVMPPKV